MTTEKHSTTSGEAPASAQKASAEMADLEARLRAAEWALERLSVVDGDIDGRIKKMLDDAVAEVEEQWAEGRERVSALVRDAEELRELAEKRLEEADARAKLEVAGQTRQLLENAEELHGAAQAKADAIVADAERRRAEIEKEMDDRLAEAEAIYVKVERHIANREAILAEVREKADQIIRNAKTTAETIRDEAIAQARKTTEIAQLETARVIQAAKDEARLQLARVTAQERDAKERLDKARNGSSGA